MKPFALLYLFCAFLLTACQSVSPEDSTVSGLPDHHTARTSLDYEGRYEVRNIVEANDIREVRLMSPDRYVVTLANGIDVTGTYSWDASGSRIALQRNGKPAWTFFVGENVLKLLNPGTQQNWLFDKFSN